MALCLDTRPRYRLAILASHPIQYQAPLYRRLAQHPRIDLTVYYCSDHGMAPGKVDTGFGIAYTWDIPLLDGYHFKFLHNYSPQPSLGFWGLFNPGLYYELKRGRFDALWVHGWYSLTNLIAFVSAWLIGIPVLVRSDSSLLYEHPGWKLALRRRLLPALFRRTAAFLTIGSLNEAFYLSYKVSPERMFLVPHAVDNEFFQSCSTIASHQAEQLRQTLELPKGRPIVLYIGKLVTWKEPLWLLEAFVPFDNQAALVFVGEGAERRPLEQAIQDHGLKNVRLIGFRNQTELPSCYALGDIFVLPSSFEPWGLVINEAMNFGLPIITTDKVGSHVDLVEHESNGFVVPTGDTMALRIALGRLVSNYALRIQYGSKSRQIISRWNYDACLGAVERALDYVSSMLDTV